MSHWQQLCRHVSEDFRCLKSGFVSPRRESHHVVRDLSLPLLLNFGGKVANTRKMMCECPMPKEWNPFIAYSHFNIFHTSRQLQCWNRGWPVPLCPWIVTIISNPKIDIMNSINSSPVLTWSFRNISWFTKYILHLLAAHIICLTVTATTIISVQFPSTAFIDCQVCAEHNLLLFIVPTFLGVLRDTTYMLQNSLAAQSWPCPLHIWSIIWHPKAGVPCYMRR